MGIKRYLIHNTKKEFWEDFNKLKKQMRDKKKWESKLTGLTKKEIEKLYKEL